MHHTILLPFTYQNVILLFQGSYKPYSRSSSLRKLLLISTGFGKRGSMDRSPARRIFFPRIDSHCDKIHSNLTAVHWFKDGYVGQKVVWKECNAEY